MEAWLLFPIRLLAVVMIAFMAYSVFEHARLPLGEEAAVVARDNSQPTPPNSHSTDWIVAAAAFVAFAIIGLHALESRAIDRLRTTCEQIAKLNGSVRFDSEYGSLWAHSLLSNATVQILESAPDSTISIDFATIPRLKTLRITNAQIDEDVVQSIAKCHRLTGLDLSNTNLRDSDVAYLCKCRGLQSLLINGTSVTDASIEHLLSCSTLNMIQCEDTGISVEGMQQLSVAGLVDSKDLSSCPV